ncbi:uncharacterized protein CLUP02_02090 [Colletotrichum lupini]|uniref:Uncharacterized protein n=1 Tax=Colletotrichum lupini TaxID=145971 RepID=A0A9Q8SDK9_9PEZI|nr:uncharacterized protein CLUP02_02090 [Colletotrichum lupini]UQC75436.1 hypothetical protein CLUP02_02090 [Colletotrichum lupini]
MLFVVGYGSAGVDMRIANKLSTRIYVPSSSSDEPPLCTLASQPVFLRAATPVGCLSLTCSSRLHLIGGLRHSHHTMPTLDGRQLLRFYSLPESETSRAQHTRSSGGDREQPDKVPFLKYPSTLVFLHGAIVAYQRLGLHFTHFPLGEYHPSNPIIPEMPPWSQLRAKALPSHMPASMIALFSSIFICIHPLSGRSYLAKRRQTRTRGIEFNLTLPARAIRPTGFQVNDTRFIQSLLRLRRPSALLLPPETHLRLGHLDPPHASRHQHNLPSSQTTWPALQITRVERSSKHSLHRRRSLKNLALSFMIGESRNPVAPLNYCAYSFDHRHHHEGDSLLALRASRGRNSRDEMGCTALRRHTSRSFTTSIEGAQQLVRPDTLLARQAWMEGVALQAMHARRILAMRPQVQRRLAQENLDITNVTRFWEAAVAQKDISVKEAQIAFQRLESYTLSHGLGCAVSACYSTEPSTVTETTTITTTNDAAQAITTTVTATAVLTPSRPTTAPIVATGASDPDQVVFKYYPSTVPKEQPISSGDGNSDGLTSGQIAGIVAGGVGLLIIVLVTAWIIIRHLNKVVQAVETSNKGTSSGAKSRPSMYEFKPTPSEVDDLSIDPLMMSPRPSHRRYDSDTTADFTPPYRGTPGSGGDYQAVPQGSGSDRHASYDSAYTGGYFDVAPDRSQRASQGSSAWVGLHRGSTDSQGTYAHLRHWSNASEASSDHGSAGTRTPLQELDSTPYVPELAASPVPDAVADTRRRSGSGLSGMSRPPAVHQRRRSSEGGHGRTRSDSSAPAGLSVVNEASELIGHYGPTDRANDYGVSHSMAFELTQDLELEARHQTMLSDAARPWKLASLSWILDLSVGPDNHYVVMMSWLT